MKMGINPRTKVGEMEDVEGLFCKMGGNHATWRRFQDKWGRSTNL